MKRGLLCALLCVLGLCACKNTSNVVLLIENSSDGERLAETVEVPWADLTARIPGLTPQQVVVINKQGVQVPSQCVPGTSPVPQFLIFQVDVPACGTVEYQVKQGVREDYPSRVSGRYVPERMDDYAWENDLVAFRMYGPALDVELKTMGVDYWSKSTTRLVTLPNEWFTRNYHQDLGEGMDCYKVGPTLGCGASAPYADGKLWLGSNYTTQETIDNGPVRVTFRLCYQALPVGNEVVNVEKMVSLDAGSYLNRMETRFYGAFDTLSVASGIVRHQVVADLSTDQCIILSEIPSDSQKADPSQDGLHHLALVLESPHGVAMQLEGHNTLLTHLTQGQSVVCYSGAAWSKAKEMAHPEEWAAYVQAFAEKRMRPLIVTVRP